MEGGVDCSRTVSSPSLGAGKKVGKILAVRVQMLDDTITMFQIQAKALGSVLFDQVCQQVNLLEADYFGLEYAGPEKVKYWLDMEKPMNRQLELSLTDPLLRFAVKFYAPDPAQLEEEFTRYLFCMQIKQDLSQGVLQCNDKTAALIASYLVQAECGDYVAEDYPDHTYLSSYKFVPHQDAELERRIMENHKKHVGQSPAEADLNLLETSRRCELYGVKMHPAKDPEGVPLNLAVAHMGVLVFQNFAKINTFSWAKVRKLSFKRKKFLIKLHPEAHGNYKDVVEFHFEGRDECKNFWKKCVEHHGFFRCTSAKNEPRPKPGVLSRGSSFRYTGRTQKEIIEYVRDNYVKRQSFQRSQSFRHTSPHHVSGVGTSMSVHPLLPVGDNVIVASGDTASCGSAAITAEARARSMSTPERTEKVDVHHHQRERDVESPSVTSNNSSSSPQHHPVYQHYQNQPAVFQHHSLPRTGASSAAHPSPSAGQIQSPCSPCCSTTSPHDSSTRLPTVISRFQKGLSQEEDNSFSSSVYTDPTTTEVGGGYKESLVSALEEVISRDSYELLSDSDSIFVSPERFTSLAAKSEAEVPYLLHRRVQTTLASSKSYETVILRSSEDVIHAETVPGADGTGVLFQRSRSFRSLREKTYRERPALFARARLVDIDLDFVVNTDVAPAPSLFRPKSIEFVSYQNLPPPDAFSSRDDTIDPVNDTADVQHFISSHLTWSAAAGIEPPSFPVVVDVDAQGRLFVEDMDEVDEEKMCSLMSGDVEEDDELAEDEILSAVSSVSSGEEPPIDADDEDRASAPEDDEALTADDVRDVDFIYQPDTLSNTTSLDGEEEEREERLVSEDLQLFGEFVNEEDGLPDPDSHNSPLDFPEEPVPPDYDDYIFQAHVLSRISERSSCDSKLSFPEEEDGERGNRSRAQQQDDTMSDVSSSFKGPSDAPIPVCPPPPIADESTPVNESVPFQEDPPPPSFPCDDQFPSPPSSIDLPDDDPELYSDSS